MGLDSVEEAAEGIIAIVNENMAGALRLVSVQRGHDPRDFALVAYGGAGPAARERGREADGLVPGDRPAGAGPALRDRRPRRRLPRRVRADLHPRCSPRRAAPRSPAILDELGGRATEWLEGEGIDEDARSDLLRRRHALPPAGLRDPGRARPGRGARERPRRPRGALQRRCTSSSTASGCRAPRARSSTCARSASAPCRSRSCRPASVGDADASGAVVDEHEVVFDGERVPTKIYDRAKLAAGRAARGPGDRDRVRLDDGRAPRATRPTVDANFNILITPNE